ncbi:MAG: PEP-CTERM sorting domain-containing protein [Phycisphaerae bacterium]
MNRSRAAFICTLAGIATLNVFSSNAQAGPIIFTSSNEALFRIDGGTTQVFTLSQPVTSMSFDPSGTLWATAPNDSDGDSFFELYKILDPFGTPSLSLVSDGLPLNTVSIEWVGNTLYGVQATGPVTTRLVTIDPLNGASTLVGATGAIGANTGGSAVDQNLGIMYGTDHGNPGNLVTIDFQLSGGPDPSATIVGSANASLGTTGLDFWEPTNTLYAMVTEIGGASNIGLYTANTATGAFTLQQDLSGFTAIRGSAAIAVIPEPATVGLIVLGVCILRRRRRSPNTGEDALAAPEPV